MIDRNEALDLLKKYNEEPFHIHHGLTLEAVMRYQAKKQGFAEDAEFWAMCGLLHDVDFEKWPEAHCKKAPELLAEINAPEDMVHAIVSHGYGLCSDVAPEHLMEKILFAMDELTGLIGAAVILRPSHSCKDMDLKSLKKKFKDKRFAAGCDRETIKQGADQLGWELEQLMAETLEAMQATEDEIAALEG